MTDSGPAALVGGSALRPPAASEATLGPETSPLTLSVDEAIRRGAENCIIFGNIFLPRAFRQTSPGFHFEVAELLAGPNRYNAFMIFRDGAKTTLLRTYALQRICYAFTHTGMIVSATQDHSIITLAWLKSQVERNKRIRQAFGIRPGKKWAETWIEIESDFSPDPITFLAFGITGQVRGFNVDDYRPDFILADDIQTEENVGTEDQRNKTHALFFGGLVNSLAPSTEAPMAKLALLQTPMTKGDIIETCVNDPLWVGKRFSIFDSNGQSIWEERHPTATLRLEKASYIRRGKYSLWMREKECEITKSEYKTFDVGNLQFWKDLPTRHQGCSSGIDPASSEDKRASDQVLMTCIRQGPDIFVAAYKAAKGQMPDQLAAEFFTHKFLFKPSKLIVETIAYQKVLKWYLEQEMLRKRSFTPIKEVKDKRAKSDRIIQALAGLVAHRHLWVHESMLELISQLDSFEPDKDGRYDIIDILATIVDDLDSPYSSGSYSDLSIEEQLEEERRAYGVLRFEGGAP